MPSNDIEYLKANYPEYVQRANQAYWHNLILLTLDSSAFTLVTAMFSQDTILPYFVTLFTNSSLLIGLVPAVYFLGYYAPQLFGAYLANRRTRRKPLILGLIISQRLGLLLIALTAQAVGLLTPQLILILFFISFMLFSLLNGVIGPAYSDFIGKNLIRRRGLYFGISYATSGAVGLLASLVARYFLDQLPSPANFQTIFWIGFGFSFLSPFIISGLREIELPYLVPPESLSTFFRLIPAHLRSAPLFLRYISARAFLGLGLMGNSFYAIYAIRKFALSEGNLGLFTMTILLAQSLLSLFWGWLGDRFGYKSVLLTAGVCLAIEASLALAAPAAWVFFVIAFLIGGVYSALWISDPNFVFEIAPPEQTSRFIGIANTLLAPIGVLGPLLAGLLVQEAGYPGLFAAILAISLLALIGVWRLVKEPRGQANFR